MTREEVLAMESGRELDALVAEKVMGFEVYKDTDCFDIMGIKDERKGWVIFRYSTDLSAAWEVVDKFMDMEISKNGSDYVASMDHPGYYVQSKSAPEAICKAALLAVMDA